MNTGEGFIVVTGEEVAIGMVLMIGGDPYKITRTELYGGSQVVMIDLIGPADERLTLTMDWARTIKVVADGNEPLRVTMAGDPHVTPDLYPMLLERLHGEKDDASVMQYSAVYSIAEDAESPFSYTKVQLRSTHRFPDTIVLSIRLPN